MHGRNLIGAAICGGMGVAACSPPPSPASMVVAGPPAHAVGVTDYRVLASGPATLDVVLLGTRTGRLRCLGSAVEVDQRIEGGTESGLDLLASADRLTLRRGDVQTVVAARARGRWHAGTKLAPDEASALRLFMAIDLDLGVQGSSVIFAGEDYVQCTFACTLATSCVSRLNDDPRDATTTNDTQDESCARAVASCAGCMSTLA
jgi:hypothetical protein